MSYFDNPEKQYDERKILDPPVHVKKELSILKKFLKTKNIKEVIEFGSGTGRLTIPLIRNGVQVTAVDISENSLEKLGWLAEKIGKKNLLKTSAVLPNIKTKAIVGTDILHHVDLDFYFKQFRSKLVNEGMIIFSEPNFLNPAWIFIVSLFLDWNEEKGIIYSNSINLPRKLKHHGFRNVKMTSLGLLPTIFFNGVPFLAKVNYWLGNLPILKLFAYRIILQAEK